MPPSNSQNLSGIEKLLGLRNEEQGTGNREQGIGNREQGIGNEE